MHLCRKYQSLMIKDKEEQLEEQLEAEAEVPVRGCQDPLEERKVKVSQVPRPRGSQIGPAELPGSGFQWPRPARMGCRLRRPARMGCRLRLLWSLKSLTLLDLQRSVREEQSRHPGAVSYTHLTLPTICSV